MFFSLVAAAFAADPALLSTEVGAIDPGATFTVEATVRLDDFGGPAHATVIEAVCLDDANKSFYLGFVRDHWQVSLEDTTPYEGDDCQQGALCAPFTPVRGATYHLRVDVTPDRATLFVDGRRLGSAPVRADLDFGDDVWAVGVDADRPGVLDSDALVGQITDVHVGR